MGKATMWIVFGVLGVATVAGATFAWSQRSVETPDYTVEQSDGDFELRQYPKLVVASIVKGGSRGEATRNAFMPLANYIFGKERGGEKIAMTAPVTQVPNTPEKIAMTAPVTQEKTGDGWTVSFIMPKQYALENLPAPAGDVTLGEVPARMIAAVRFSGRWTDARFEQQTQRLNAWVETQGLTTIGPVEYAYYNDPFTPSFLRRNEVMVPVTR